jgi:UDP-N-acetylglucosamine 3-dehydrogenase
MKILIVGCGYMGELHLRILKNKKLADVAIYDKNKERLEEISQKYDIKEKYLDLNKALNNNVSGAIVCTPNNFHSENAIQIMDHGISVMVEKPISNSVTDAEKMIKIADKKKLFIFVGYTLRFVKPYIKIKNMIHEGKLGNIFSLKGVVSSRRALTDAVSNCREQEESGGGIVLDFSHEIDYARWFVGTKVKEVYCKGSKIVHKNWNVEDTADIILTFDNNVTSSIHMDYLQPFFYRSLEVYGTRGTILWRDFENIKFYSEDDNKWFDIEVEKMDFDEVYYQELKHYIDCLLNNKKPMITGEDALITLKIADSCINSTRKNNIIYI